MIVYYIMMSVMSLILLALFVFHENDTRISYYVRVLGFVMLLANLGYVALGISNNIETAMLANKVSYLGGCFLPPLMFFCMATVCNIKINRYIKVFMYAYSVFVYSLVLTVELSDFYYKDIELSTIADATSFVNVHGPGYTFFSIILYGYIILNVGMTSYAFIKKKSPKRILLILLSMQVITIVSFIVGRAINSKLEVMPAVYVMDGILFWFLQGSITKYNLDGSIFTAMQHNNTSGYVVFDTGRRLINYNDIAGKCVEGLAKCRLEERIKEDCKAHYLYQWLVDYEAGVQSDKELVSGNKYYEGVIKDIVDDGIKTGYLVELRDSTEHKKYLDLISNYNEELKSQVDYQTKHIREMQSKIILGMANMVENRDDNTGGHIKRTSDIIRILIEVIRENQLLELTNEFCEDLIKAAPMHDLGKVAIDDDILRKPGKFTHEEFEIMKSHAEKSAEICETILSGVEEEHFVKIAVNVARHHHEKWDGSGYPMHLSHDNIPLEARIMAIADVYDALVSKRCYKEPYDYETANEIMMSSMGTHFDPALAKAFELTRPKLEAYYSKV